MAGDWQSIETAPRDGTRIIGWFGDRAIIVFWRSGPEYERACAAGNKVWYWSDGYYRFREADCWQPEPKGPDTAQFPVRDPPPKPRGPTTVTTSPAARRRIVEQKPKRHVLVEQPVRKWCDQCQRSVNVHEAKFCASLFCKAKVEAA